MGVIIRQSFKASLSNYVGVVLGFLNMFILFPLFFEPEEMGAIRLFIELGTVLSAFALIGTNSSINRFFPYFKTKDQKNHGFFFWAFLVPMMGFIFLITFLFIYGNQFFPFLNENALQYKALFPMLICLIFANIFIIITEVSCANHGRIAVPNFSKEVLMRILIIGSGTLFYFDIVSFNTCVWLIAFSYLSTMTLNIFYLKSLTKINLKPDFKFLNENRKLRKEIILFSSVLVFSALSSLVIPKIDFFLVSKLQNDLGKVAIYSIGFYLATFIEIPKRTILQISLPIISGHLKKNEMVEMDSLNKKNGTNQMVISTFLFLLIWLNIDNFYNIMPNGDYYSEGKWVFFIIGLSKVFESVNSTYSPIISNSSLYKWMPLIIVFNAGSSILFNYFFILKYGYIGGAISNIIAMFVLNILCLTLIQIKLNINPFERKQIRIVFIFTLFLLLTFFGNWFTNPFVDGTIRSVIFAIAYIYIIFKSNASTEINQILEKQLSRLKK